MDNMFDNQAAVADKNAEEYQRKLKEYEEKLNSYQRERASWEDERRKLEGHVQDLSSQVEVARNFEKVIQEDPGSAIERILGYHKKNRQAQENPMNELLTPLKQKLDTIERSLQEERQEKYVERMENSILDSLDVLKEKYGVEGDPKYVIQYLRDNEIYNPNQVSLAVKALYIDQIGAAKKQTDVDAVVLGTQGYTPTEAEKLENTKLPSNSNDESFWTNIEKLMP